MISAKATNLANRASAASIDPLSLDGVNDKVVLDKSEILAYNRSQARLGPDMIVDMRSAKTSISAAKLIKENRDGYLWDASLSGGPYVDAGGDYWTPAELAQITANANLDSYSGSLKARYAITVAHTDFKNVPSDAVFADKGDDGRLNLFQVASLGPDEPLLIFATSADGQWYYAHSYLCTGWVKASSIGFTDRGTYERYAGYAWGESADFLTVIGRSYSQGDTSWQMGSIIPLAAPAAASATSYQIKSPASDSSGDFTTTTQTITADPALYLGWQPYTSRNLVKSALCWYGDTYGWGEGSSNVDCSGLVNVVYRTCGVLIPKNSAAIGVASGAHILMSGKSDAQRLKTITKLPSASILCIKGHILFYLGKQTGVPYVLQATGGFWLKPSGKEDRVLKCLVTDLSPWRKLGTKLAPTYDCIVNAFRVI